LSLPPPPPRENEGRQHRRYSVDVEATVTLVAGTPRKMRTRDLSRNGICLLSDSAIAPGTEAKIELMLAFGNDAYSEPLLLSARVVWCSDLAGTYQVGAIFEDITDQQDDFLEMFLQFLDGTLSPKDALGDEDSGVTRVGQKPDDKDNPFNWKRQP